MNNNLIKLQQIMEDPEKAVELLALSPEEVQVKLKEEHDLDIDIEDLKDFAAGVSKALSEMDDELSSEELDSVAGGGKKSVAYSVGYYTGKIIKTVGAVGSAVGAVSLIASLSW